MRRDKEVSRSLRKGKRQADRVIFNNGDRSDLQIAADEVYESVIKQKEKTKQTMREKYKVENIPQKSIFREKKRSKDKRKIR